MFHAVSCLCVYVDFIQIVHIWYIYLAKHKESSLYLPVSTTQKLKSLLGICDTVHEYGSCKLGSNTAIVMVILSR